MATTTVMAVQDRVREHAVLQAIGYSGPLVFALVLCECVVITVAGGVLGVGSALGALWWNQLSIGTEGVTVSLAPSLGLLGEGLLVSLVVGVIAGVVPAWRSSQAEIVPALRAL